MAAGGGRRAWLLGLYSSQVKSRGLVPWGLGANGSLAVATCPCGGRWSVEREGVVDDAEGRQLFSHSHEEEVRLGIALLALA